MKIEQKIKKMYLKFLSISGLIFTLSTTISYGQNYPIVDTGVSDFYNNNTLISSPSMVQSFYGQDAHYNGNQPSYTNNGNGTITDNVTGLMWEQDMGTKISYSEAFTKATNSTLGGYTDWRVPTIKELYSLSLFTGRCFGNNAVIKFIDTNYFIQPIGNTSIGEREIDAQTWSSTQYTSLIMNGAEAVFGFNFVDGRLKGYPKYNPQTGLPTTMYFRMVRGNTAYGINNFMDNGDGTVTDSATGLMWQKADDGILRNWENALLYCENLSLADHSDWRLPNAKELQSIVDYNRSPDFTNSPAIDPIFSCSSINNPNGISNYGYYWTSSPLMDGPTPYTDAVYISFGEAQGQMAFPPANIPTIYDTHGAGAQRNDPKEVGTNTYPTYFGPQGDILYVNNYVRAVRNVNSPLSIEYQENLNFILYPNPTESKFTIKTDHDYSQLNIKITTIFGEIVAEYSFEDKNEITIQLNEVAGIYLIYVQSFDGDSTTFKIIKK
jgi:hypothetical protein